MIRIDSEICICWACQRRPCMEYGERVCGHVQARTGQTIRYLGSVKRGWMNTFHEYVCTCGARGKSRSNDVLKIPVVSGSDEEIRQALGDEIRARLKDRDLCPAEPFRE